MEKEYWYITDKQIKLARENGACAPALEWAEKERDWRKISAEWLAWDVYNTELCPVEALIELSKDSDSSVRYLVARHPNTPVEVLIELSKDSDWGVRDLVAQHPNTPVEVVIWLLDTELSKDSNLDISYSFNQ